MRIFIVLMLLLLAGATQAETDTLSEAQRAQEAGDYAKAAALFIPLAKQGDPVAQFNLGVLYTQGLVIMADYREAVQWYLAAAEQGHAQAQANLGELYAKGQGVAQDFKKAMRWLDLSAKQGNATAQLHIGDMYANGQGVRQDYQEAIKWYRLAADQGNAISQQRLGECYENGRGVAQDSALAREWMSTAADNASDAQSRKAYLSRRDAIDKGIAERHAAQEQKLAKEAEERAKAAEIARVEAARVEAEKAALLQAAEQARLKAAADAALQVQIKAYNQAKVEAQAAKLKALQDAKDAREAASVRRKAERIDSFRLQEDRRRAEINAEVARRRLELKTVHKSSSKTQHPSSKALADTEPQPHESGVEGLKTVPEPHSGKTQHPASKLADKPHKAVVDVVPIKETEGADSQPLKPLVSIRPNFHHPEADKSAAPPLKSNVSTGKTHYPAKVELTDEELGLPATHAPNETVKAPVKQIEWSKKPSHP